MTTHTGKETQNSEPLRTDSATGPAPASNAQNAWPPTNPEQKTNWTPLTEQAGQGCPIAHTVYLHPVKLSWLQRHPILFAFIFLGIFIGVTTSLASLYAGRTPTEDYVGIINVEGMILENKHYLDWINELSNDAKAKAVVVYVDSPGGAVSPSQELYTALKRLSQKKPLLISMGSVAASGGYYIALAGQEIYANPSTLTASIGVKLELLNVENLMKTLGISSTTLVTGDLKDAGSVTRTMTPEEKEYFTALIDDMYEEFIDTVVANRDMPRELAYKLADGRAMTGRQALTAGLVDHIGDKHTVIRRAAALAELKDLDNPTIFEGPLLPEHTLQKLLRAALPIDVLSNSKIRQPLFYY